jgi:hypothetical protein
VAQYSDFSQPAYLPGHTLKAHHSGGVDHIKIVAVRHMGTHEHDWGALTANTLSAGNECPHLKVNDGEIANYRFYANDSLWVFPNHPAASKYYQSKTFADTQLARWGINRWEADRSLAPVIQQTMWAASDIWVWQDDVPTWDLRPIISSLSSQGYVHFFGWRYAWESLPTGQEGQADLWIDTWPDTRKK